jgi:type III restriction enzyme
VASANFASTAGGLRDALVGCGFEHFEAKGYVQQQSFEYGLYGVPPVPCSPKWAEPFRVPRLAVARDGQLELFDESSFLDEPLDLTKCDVGFTEDEFASSTPASRTETIDVNLAGRIYQKGGAEVREQLRLLEPEKGWSLAALVLWLDRNIRHPDITAVQSGLYLQRVVTGLLETRGVSLEQLARVKYALRDAAEARLRGYREKFRREAELQLFRGYGPEVQTVSDFDFDYHRTDYSPNSYYQGGIEFKKHYYNVVGELKPNTEEEQCAVYLDNLPSVQFWVRNLERRPESSFWLQTATDKFYPDFVAQLVDGRILVVEYKGEHLWSNDDSKEKRALGRLWAEKSGGKCLFVMPEGTKLQEIAALLP